MRRRRRGAAPELALEVPLRQRLEGPASLSGSWSLLLPQVRHRWCELVVKHRHARAYGHVERFLLEDQVRSQPAVAATPWQPSQPGFRHRQVCGLCRLPCVPSQSPWGRGMHPKCSWGLACCRPLTTDVSPK